MRENRTQGSARGQSGNWLFYLNCLIMISKLSNENSIVVNFINDAMFAIDSARPKTRQSMFQGFWFSNTFIWNTLNISY